MVLHQHVPRTIYASIVEMTIGRCIVAGVITATATFAPLGLAVAIGGAGASFLLAGLMLLAAIVGPWWGASLARQRLGPSSFGFPKRSLIIGCWIGLLVAANPNWHVVSLPDRPQDATIAGLGAFFGFLWLGAAVGAAAAAFVGTHVVIRRSRPGANS